MKIIHTHIVYDCKTPNYADMRCFTGANDVMSFLRGKTFMQPHMLSRVPTTVPLFCLGTQMRFMLDGYNLVSQVVQGPRFLVATDIRHINGEMMAYTPMDDLGVAISDNMIVTRKYQWTPVNSNCFDAIINTADLSQIWPQCDFQTSVLNQFMNRVAAQKYTIHKR